MINEEFYSLVEGLALINEESDIDLPTILEMEEAENKKSDEETSDVNPREAVREAIKPQVEIATSTISSIKDAFADNCNNAKTLEIMETQIKNWETTIHGACRTIVSVVEGKGLIKKNENGKYIAWDGRELKKVCAPRAYKKIMHEDSRDMSTLDLSAAIIIFYNSLS